VIIINFLTGGIQCHLWLLITDFAVIAVGQSSYSGTSLAATVNKKFSTTLTSLAVVSYHPITGSASAGGDTAPDPQHIARCLLFPPNLGCLDETLPVPLILDDSLPEKKWRKKSCSPEKRLLKQR